MTTRLDDLKGLRKILLESLEEAPPDKRGPLAAQLRATLADIDALEGQSSKAVDPIDEIAQRRAARTAGATRGAVRANLSS